VVGRVDVLFPVPFLAIPLGAFGSSGNRAMAGPFVAAGWTGGRITGAPWVPSTEVRAVVGAQLEMFHRLLRAEVGVGLRDRTVNLGIDVRRDLWPIL
jgi:hypothetical protein